MTNGFAGKDIEIIRDLRQSKKPDKKKEKTNIMFSIPISSFIRVFVKDILQVLILVFSYFCIFILIREIYGKYGDNVFVICYVPFISFLISNLIITPNINALKGIIVTSTFTKYFEWNRQKSLFSTIIHSQVHPYQVYKFMVFKKCRDMIKSKQGRFDNLYKK